MAETLAYNSLAMTIKNNVFLTTELKGVTDASVDSLLHPRNAGLLRHALFNLKLAVRWR